MYTSFRQIKWCTDAFCCKHYHSSMNSPKCLTFSFYTHIDAWIKCKFFSTLTYYNKLRKDIHNAYFLCNFQDVHPKNVILLQHLSLTVEKVYRLWSIISKHLLFCSAVLTTDNPLLRCLDTINYLWFRCKVLFKPSLNQMEGSWITELFFRLGWRLMKETPHACKRTHTETEESTVYLLWMWQSEYVWQSGLWMIVAVFRKHKHTQSSTPLTLAL